MLSTPDAALSRRDPALPGLGLVLDAGAMGERIAAALPGLSIVSSEATYTRYKPRGGCVVAYRLGTDRGDLIGVARAFPADALAKMVKDDDARGLPPAAGVPPALLFPEQRASFSFFPNDRRLPALRGLADARVRRRLLRNVAPSRPELWEATIAPLAYKPGRRFVARLSHGDRQAVLRLYGAQELGGAIRAVEAFAAVSPALVPSVLGTSERHRAVVTTWIPGTSLDRLLQSGSCAPGTLFRAGEAVALIHRHPGRGLVHLTTGDVRAAIVAAASAVASLSPDLEDRASRIGGRVMAGLVESRSAPATIHGDLTADQIVVGDASVGLIDLDRAGRGDPASDLGKMLAGFERDRLHGRASAEEVVTWSREFLDGYRHAGGADPGPLLRVHVALWLLTFAPEPFRMRDPDWPHGVEQMITAAEACLVS